MIIHQKVYMHAHFELMYNKIRALLYMAWGDFVNSPLMLAAQVTLDLREAWELTDHSRQQ
jgi:hypothetical protein